MGELLTRRRGLILPSGGDDEDWDYVWRYTDGLLEDNGWTKVVSGDGSSSMTASGQRLTSRSGYVTIRRPSFNTSIGVLEVVLTVNADANNQTYARICLSNGSRGIQIFFPKGKIALYDDAPYNGNYTVIGENGNTGHKIRLVLNGNIGAVYIDGQLAIDNVSISRILYATYTAVWSQTQSGNDTIIKSVKVKLGRI